MASSLLLAASAWAQSGPPVPRPRAEQSSDTLWQRVKSGDTVFVTDSTARESAGVLATLSDSTLTLLVEGSLRDIPLADVKQVSKRGGDSLWNGFLVGLGAGAVMGIVDVTTPCPSGDSFWCEDYTHLSTGKKTGIAAGDAMLFGGIGALVDYLHKGRTIVYSAPARPKVALRPMLDGPRREVGLQVCVR